jgi:hypothetical protein
MCMLTSVVDGECMKQLTLFCYSFIANIMTAKQIDISDIYIYISVINELFINHRERESSKLL